ncbi:MAG TPA: hypothetical protein PLC04_01470 [Candidatus Kapabacteria bacterium]|jgi:hypothetical protein|nr:hypothetical protein [Candidatus Kapabacteria bacterium]HOV91733.1 hypothetical protein [Candidatus Kapabacteria bacterium]
MTHLNFIESKLKASIENDGILKVGVNLNNYLSFEDANIYAKEYVKNFTKRITNDKARQEKSSKDSVLGKLVEEIIVYLLINYFSQNGCNYLVTNNKNESELVKNLVKSLRIERKNSSHQKNFDSDIIIYNQKKIENEKKIFILSAKGTTRERIGQFLSHLFLMDQDVLNAKYGKDRYEVVFAKEKIKLKYAFVTFDWARDKDFLKHSRTGKVREGVKTTEIQLILDDVKMGGGIYVLNNYDNMDGIGNFGSLVGKICDYLK